MKRKKRRKKRRKSYRRNPKMKGQFGRNFKELMSKDTWKDVGGIVVGSIGTPMLAAGITGLVNKTKPDLIPVTGVGAKIVDILSAIGLSAGVTIVTKSAKYGRLVMLGGVSSVVSDFTSETILPKIGLSDYLSVDQIPMRDYLTLPPSGMRDYLTADQIPVNDYLTLPPEGINDYATPEDIMNASPYNEEF